MKDPHGRIGRWLMELEQYDYHIDHRPGKANSNADALSRAPIVLALSATTLPTEAPTNPNTQPHDSEEGTEDDTPPSVRPPPLHEIWEYQQADPVMRGYISFLRYGTLQKVPEDIRPLLLDLDNYSAIDDVLYHIWTPPRQPSRLQLVVPRPLRRAVLLAHHENALTGHRGIQGTYDRLRRNYFWINMMADVVAWVNSCMDCAKRKKRKYGQSAGLHPIPTNDRPFDTIAMDYLGPLPKTVAGNKYILVVNDYATRYCMAYALKAADAVSTAKTLVKRVFLEYGPPTTILSDRGTHFNNDLVDSILDLFNTRHIFSSGYRPQTAGITERLNQTLLDILAMYVSNNQRDWDEILPYAVFAYRTLYNPTVKDVPFFLLYGYEPILPHEMYILPPHINQSLADRERNVIAQRLNHARNLARASVKAVQHAMKERADTHRREPRHYVPGDLVMAIKPQLGKTGVTVKLAKIYDGPYKVATHLPGSRTMQLIHVRTGEPRLAHIDNVKPYIQSELREDEPYEEPTPQPTPAQELRAVEHLEKACAVAKHVVGDGRARATANKMLGALQLQPLPPELMRLLPQTPLPSPPQPHRPQPDNVARQPRNPQQLITPPSNPKPITSPTATWKGKIPWFMPGSMSTTQPTTTTTRGRNVRPRILYNGNIHAHPITPPIWRS